METIIYIGILSLFWIVNLVNGTGLDLIYHITRYAKYIIILASVFKLLADRKTKCGIYVDRNDVFVFGGMSFVFFFSSEIHGNGTQALDYLWVFAIVYLLSSLPISDKVLTYTAWIYGAAGAAILYIYNYGTVLSGWNENSIAMIGMHSFLVFSIPYFKEGKIKSKVLLIVATVLFSALIQPTDSRSGILFLILGLVFALNLIPRTIIYGSSTRLVVMLLVPLFVAILVSLVSQSGYMGRLNVWSYEQFKKPIFNGRDILWRYGFSKLFSSFLIGIGSMSTANWHNSAITCLVAFGSMGYILWICAFRNIIGKALNYLDDYLIQGCIVAFIVLYLQQSVELGIISASPSVIPYVMLGMMLGRVKYLGSYEVYGNAQN